MNGPSTERLKPDLIARRGRTGLRRAGWELDRDPRTEHHRGHSPRLQIAIDLGDLAAPVEKNDIDRKAHEEHVHPHHWREAAIFEEHAGARFEAVTTEQAAALAAETARIFEPLAEHGAASLIHRSNDICHRYQHPTRLFPFPQGKGLGVRLARVTRLAALSPYRIM